MSMKFSMGQRQETIYSYTVLFEPAEEGGYVVHVPSLPGCVTQGETFEEARAMAEDVIQLYIETLKDSGDDVPVERENIIVSRVATKIFA